MKRKINYLNILVHVRVFYKMTHTHTHTHTHIYLYIFIYELK